MQQLIKSLLLAIALVSCGTDTDSRYRDISHLERPPTLPTSGSTASSGAAYTADDSRIEKKSQTTGLADSVYLTNTDPIQLKIKQPLDKAWGTVGLGLKQTKNAKVTDRERDKKIYYVAYNPSSLFDFLIEGQEVIYQLKLKQDGKETVVTVEQSVDQNRSSSNNDGHSQGDDSENLLKLLYQTLHDDLEQDL